MDSFRNIPESGSGTWKDNVASATDLPFLNNTIGDKRQVLDTKTIYSWDGTSWIAIASPAAAIAIDGLEGDVTATGPGVVQATLKTVNVNVGSFGNASQSVSFSVDGKGRVTSASQQSIQITESQVTNLVNDLAGKQSTITGGASSIVTANLTANRALISDASGKVATNAVTSTELGYLSGVTSAIQTQLNGKFNNPTGTATDYIAGDGSILPFPTLGAADRLITTVYNSTGSIVPAGSVIYLNGPHGNLPELVLAQANSELNSSLTYGITQTDIGNMSSGIAVQEGRLENLNTNVSGWNEGDVLYLSPTVAGGITNVKPYAPNHLVIVGTLVRKHPAQGVIQVKIQNGYELNELHNVQILTTPADGDVLTYELSTSLWKNKPITITNKLTKGTNTIFCIDNGDYATLQAAIDAAPAYPASCTILVGAKSGGWGDIVLPANKNLSITGLSAPKSEQIVFVNSVTFSPTTGTNPVANNIHLSNLFINPQTAIQAVTFSGTAPARLRLTGCYIYANAATSTILSNTNNVYSSATFTDCYFDMGNTSNTHVSSSLRYAVFDRCNFNAGNKGFNVTAGFTQIGLTGIQVNSTAEIISIGGTNTLVALVNSLIQNTTTNGSGVLVGSGSYFQNVSNILTVATGTGYCVRGTGIHLYGQISTGNSVLSANNVKMQNTLTNVPYTIGLTSSA